MRDTENNSDPAGGGAQGPVQNSPAIDPAAEAQQKAADWWDNFAHAVENPRVSTYDYLKDSFLRELELNDSKNVGDFLNKAQQKAVKEALSLTDLRELSKTIERFERSKLLFDYRTRAGIKCARVVLDTYLSAKDEYETDMERRRAWGLSVPSPAQQEAEIKKIVDKKLAEGEVAEQIGEMAQIMTGKDKDDIDKTVKEAARQLRYGSNLRKISKDVVGISEKYLTVDNAVNIGVHALPLLTWKYRWAVALVFGAYVSRMAVYHGYKAGMSKIKGEKDEAREHGQQALKTLKAAGGNILAIAISPVIGKLPAKIAMWGVFAANFIYGKTLELGEYLLKKKQEAAESEIGMSLTDKIKRAGKWLHKNVVENLDAIITISARAIRREKPNQYTRKIENASKRIKFSNSRSMAQNFWLVAKAAGRRCKREFNRAAGIVDHSDYEHVFEAARRYEEQQREASIVSETEQSEAAIQTDTSAEADFNTAAETETSTNEPEIAAPENPKTTDTDNEPPRATPGSP